MVDPFKCLGRQKFGLIMADPPWSYTAYSEKGHDKGALAQYACMGLYAIKALPVQDIAEPDCWLMLWATNPCLEQAFEVVRAWGFTYSTKLTWLKTGKSGALSFGTGHVVRSCDEPILIGRRGNPRLYTKSMPSAFFARRRQHSRKPDESFCIAETMFGSYTKRIELFSREKRDGWSNWGDESNMFNEAME